MGELKMNIFQKMLAIQSELESVSKNLNVKSGSQTYKAVSERDVLDAVKKMEEKHGVYSYCYDREIVMTQETTSKSGAVNFWQRLRCKYRFVNIENPQEFIETVTYADGVDTMDKGSGKAMTYADKYALMKAYKISTGDDPDQQGSEEQENKKPVVKATDKQLQLIEELYTNGEIDIMLQRLGKDFYSLTVEEASKMIKARKDKQNG